MICPKHSYVGVAYLGQGRHRKVYALNDRYVIKIAIDEYDCGLTDNQSEATWSRYIGKKADDSGAKYALCRILKCGCLIMERVKTVDWPFGYSLPEWTNDIDSGQVGFARDGRLVAYDYGAT